jgi:hypothetical protein
VYSYDSYTLPSNSPDSNKDLNAIRVLDIPLGKCLDSDFRKATTTSSGILSNSSFALHYINLFYY